MPVNEPLAAVLFRPDQVPTRALSFGFALAAAGSDAPDPHLLVAPLRAAPGWSAAFWHSGARRVRGGGFTAEDEMEHARELFEDELPPGLLAHRATRELARECGDDGAARAAGAAPVYALLLEESPFCDDGWRFDDAGVTRRFLRDGDDGLEAGYERADGAAVEPMALEISEAAGDEEERREVARLATLHGGAAMIGAEMAVPLAAALMAALYEADEKVPVRLVEPGPESAAREAARLVRVLGRTAGRGAFEPAPIVGVDPPAAHRAFAATYDWADPADAADLYRGLAIGRIEGDLRWARPAEAEAAAKVAGWETSRARGLYPVATLRAGALGSSGNERFVAVDADGSTLWLAPRDARQEPRLAGPTFTELLRYLALGWSRRDAAGELVIGALMLRARVRAGDS
jgi:hypothetical protein